MPSFQLNELIVLPDLQSLVAYFASLGASLSFAVAFTFIHRLYYQGNSASPGVERSFLLIAPAVTAIFLVIQFSLPLSLGLLGALSFVRFRTPVKEPEEIGFILVLIGSALCCAVFRFEVAFALALVTGSIALLRNSKAWPNRWFRSSPAFEMFVTSSHQNEKGTSALREILEVFRRDAIEPEVLSVSEVDSQASYHLKFHIKGRVQPEFSEEISSKVECLKSVNNVNLICHAS